jgi:hypothetical protein
MTETKRKNLRLYCPQITLPLQIAPLLLLSAPLAWYMLYFPTSASHAAAEGMKLAFLGVLPTLFPFLALSSLLLTSGIAERVLRLPARAVAVLFGCSEAGALALLIGCFCGFPVGGRLLSDLATDGKITATERNRLLPLANHPSLPFLFSVVGDDMLKSEKKGLLLFLSVVLSTLLLGVFTRREGKRQPAPLATTAIQRTGAAVVTESIGKATATALSASGFIVFFAVCSASAEALFAAVRLPSVIALPLSGMLEVSGGMKKAAEMMGNPASRLCGNILCGFFAGFGGLSAHLQVIATVNDRMPGGAEESLCTLRSFVCRKLIEGGLSALVYLLLVTGIPL